MTETNRLAKLMAATSVLALALGMTAQAANQPTNQAGTTAATSDQHKVSTGFLKHDTEFLKHNCTTEFLKHASTQLKYECAQHKLPTMLQGKHSTPSTELNPQPDPPLDVNKGGHTIPSTGLNPQPEPPIPPRPTGTGTTPH